MTHPNRIVDEGKWWDEYVKKGPSAQRDNPTSIQKERCLNILGRKIACVQDEAAFKWTPGIVIGGIAVLFLLTRR